MDGAISEGCKTTLQLGRVSEPAREVEEEGELSKSKTKEQKVTINIGEHLAV